MVNRTSIYTSFFKICPNRFRLWKKHPCHLPRETFRQFMRFSAIFTRFAETSAVFNRFFFLSASANISSSPFPSFYPCFQELNTFPVPDLQRWLDGCFDRQHVCSHVLSSPPPSPPPSPSQLSPFTFANLVLAPGNVLILYCQHQEWHLVNCCITAHREEFGFCMFTWESSVKDMPRCKNFLGSSHGCSGTV